MQTQRWLSAVLAAVVRWWNDEAYAVGRDEIIPILVERESLGYWELFALIPRGARNNHFRLKRALDRALYLLQGEGIVELETGPKPAQYLSVMARDEDILAVRCAICA